MPCRRNNQQRCLYMIPLAAHVHVCLGRALRKVCTWTTEVQEAGTWRELECSDTLLSTMAVLQLSLHPTTQIELDKGVILISSGKYVARQSGIKFCAHINIILQIFYIYF